jgi:hypothetical protein
MERPVNLTGTGMSGDDTIEAALRKALEADQKLARRPSRAPRRPHCARVDALNAAPTTPGEPTLVATRGHESKRSGRNGCRGGIAGVGSPRAGSLHSYGATLCRQPGSSIASPSRAKLFHEEPGFSDLPAMRLEC